MNKDSKAVKKEKGLFESVIAPIIVGIMFIFLYQKEYGGVLVCGIGLILMLSLYFVFVKQSKKG
ncbi:hypothetical protein [Bacillus wiedmannii]|uniref:hypothetical protein n=1 Tax=Bacillus wiedmannii TaxID=1890302 RepID=UPI002E1F5714|nr:hypothetical protein [Bacillus wiedmannii]